MEEESEEYVGVIQKRIRARSEIRFNKNQSFWNNLRQYMMEFGDATDIQGLRYVTEDRSRVEKCVWAIIILVCMGVCIYWMYYLIIKYERQPIIVSFQAKEEPIFSIPFPAITICPETKHKSNFSYDMAKSAIHAEGKVISEDILANYLDQLLLCEIDLEEEIALEKELRKRGNTSRFGLDYINVLIKMQLKIDDYMFMCRWMGVLRNCSELFTPILTSQGICHSFNIVHRKHIFAKKVLKHKHFYDGCDKRSHFSIRTLQYDENEDMDTYPRRASFAGGENALKIFLMQDIKFIDSACTKGLAGFRIEVHNSQELPHPRKYYYRIPLDTSTELALEPKVMGTASSVRDYPVNKRFCYMPHERKLKFFKVYNPQLCYKECLTNFTYKNCECVAFYMPRTKDMPICGPPKLDCVQRQEYELEKAQVEAALKSGHGSGLNDRMEMDVEEQASNTCNCEPLCNTLSYGLQMSTSGWDWKHYYRYHHSAQKVVDMDSTAMSMVTIYLKRDYFLSVMRHEIYGITEFISSIGGLLNLFTGITVLSVVELIYFCSLRIVCNKKLYGPWSGKPAD